MSRHITIPRFHRDRAVFDRLRRVRLPELARGAIEPGARELRCGVDRAGLRSAWRGIRPDGCAAQCDLALRFSAARNTAAIPSKSDARVRAASGGITVDLSSDAFANTSVSSGTATAGIQQLVWTVTSAAQQDVPVTVLVDGARGYRAWGSVSLDQPLRRDARARTSVWIDGFRDGSGPCAQELGRLLDDDLVALTGPIRLELLLGARRSDEQRLRRPLSALVCWFP